MRTTRRRRIGEDVSEQLEYIPGEMVVLRHVYPKYACSCCKDGVTSAAPVANPIEHRLAAPGLLAYVLVSKYAEHVPLYRQQDVLARHGIPIASGNGSRYYESRRGCPRPWHGFAQRLW